MAARFIFKGLVFLLVCILVSFCLQKLFFPFTWGNIQLNTKIKFIEKNNLNPNIYFIGSSITFRQVIPSIIDEFGTDKNKNSFNMGLDAIMPPFQFYVLENLMSFDESIDYIFFELDSFDFMPDNQYLTGRRKYYWNLKWLHYALQYLKHSDLPEKRKQELTKKYKKATYESIFKLGMKNDIAKYLSGQQLFPDHVIGTNGDGYLQLPGNITPNKMMQDRMPKYLDNVKNGFASVYQNLNHIDHTKGNEFWKNLAYKYIKQAKENDIHIIYILNPRQYNLDSYESMVSLLYSLPEENRMDMANPYEHPQLYEIQYRWDEAHLNDKGSKLYSKILGEKFSKLKSTLNN